ncbi:MAG: amidohydrolase family protein [Xanthomonadales bacterium]|nr:amidohydrolase family protein [Xanthomonadales bacterium]
MSSLLIRNGTIVTATDHYRADVLIRDESVSAIGARLDERADRTIDASDCYLFPGGIDAHTHMELPFMGTFASDTFHSGTLAGLHGGTTTIVDFAIQTQGDSLEAAIREWHRKADGHAVGDYAFHCAVTDFNERTRQEIPRVIHEHGINSFPSRPSWPTRAR